MLSCYGLQAILVVYIPRNLHTVATVVVICLVALEYYQPPISPDTPYQPQYQWIDWLAAEDNQDAIHLINLPMGRHRSKRYLHHQTLHGYPQVEGLASRTPAAAYNYIEANFLLSAWRAGESVICLPSNQLEYIAAHDQLLSDGFTHVVLHRGSFADEYPVASFVNTPASYVDEHVVIYRLKYLRDTCDATAALDENIARYTRLIAESGSIVPRHRSAIISINRSEALPIDAPEKYLATLSTGAGPLKLEIEHLQQASNTETSLQHRQGYDHIESNSAIHFVYDPSVVDPDLVAAYRSWLARIFNSCAHIADTEDTVIEYYLRHGFPCQLAAIDESLAVDYDNGMQLGNLLSTHDESFLDVYLLWKRRTTEKHSVSIQFFDGAGSKIHGQDFVIRREPLAHHRIDLSALPSGDFSAKLIVYNHDTGVSVPGVLRSSQTRFDRELEFAAITVE